MNRNLLFILVISIFATLIKYEFAISDQRAQIPLILNEINTDYLTHDFFVSVNETYGPRFYYSKFMAIGGQLMTMPGWFLFLSIFCAFLTSWLTYLTFKQIFYDENRAVLAAIFVLVLPTPTLAESTYNIYGNVLTPSGVVFPMLIGAFYYFFKNQKLVVPMILVGIASLFQVLYGLTTGLLILFAFFCSRFILSNGKIFYSFKKILIGVLVLGLFVSASMIPYYTTAVSDKMSTSEFVEIVAYFRAAHHYVPTAFPLKTWFFTICFFSAAILVALQVKKHFINPSDSNDRPLRTKEFYTQSVMIASAILFGFVLGYVFVEIIPTKLVTTAQTFRYVVLLKWLACLYFAAWMPLNKLRLSAVLHPVSLFLSQIVEFFISKEKQPKYYDGLIVILTLGIVALIPQREQIFLLKAIFVLIIAVLYNQVKFQQLALAGMTIVTIGLVVSPFVSQRFLPEKIDNLLSKIYPKYDYNYLYHDDLKELSAIIAEKTDEKETLIVPPDLLDIRYSANRAIVVDFKAIPFQDEALLEFRKRLRDCYGDTDKLGFEAQEAMKNQYIETTYPKLQSLKAEYKANYAVLEAENNIKQNVIFENESYKLVEIE